MNPHDKKIIYSPRTGEEMQRATEYKVPILLYSDLCRLAESHGSNRMLAHLFKRSNDNIILLQDPAKMSSGHWIAVSRIPSKKQIYFFSTYGGKPDKEKIRWIPEDELIESGQYKNIFIEGLKNLQEHGWEIHYNNYPFQKEGDNTATCGIYTVAFLKSKMNPDDFAQQTFNIQKVYHKDPAIYYFNKYFSF